MKIYKIFLLSILSITLFSCKKDDEEILVALPTITTIDPVSVAVGNPVVIKGSNFSSEVSRNDVRFFQGNISVNGTVTTAAANSISTNVPSNLTPGEYFVEVTVEGKSAISADKLIVTASNAALTVNSFAPTSGEKGTIVTVQGYNFSVKPGETSVFFVSSMGLFEGVVKSVTTSTLKVGVPTNITKEAFDIVVKVGEISTIAKGKFTVTPTILPTITGVSSSSVYQGSTFIISGFNFGLNPENYQVTFKNEGGSANGMILDIKDNSLNVVIPYLPNGEYALNILKFGESVNTSSTIQYVSPPFTFAGFSRSGGSASGALTLAGNGFSSTLSNNKVEFIKGDLSVEATVKTASSNALEVTVPSSSLHGTYYIRITISGQSVTLLHPFTGL